MTRLAAHRTADLRTAASAPTASWARRACLLLVLVFGGLTWSEGEAQAARKQLSVEEQYNLGLRYLKRGYYVKALEEFNRIRNYHRDDPYAIKAELAIADVYYKKAEWDQARLAYEDFMRMHPRNAELDYVVFRIGMSVYKKAPRAAGRDQTWTRQAVNTWSNFDTRFPDSAHKADVAEKYTECKERLAKKELVVARFYRNRKAWTAVEGRAQGLQADHAGSEAAKEGLVLLAEAQAWRGEAEAAAATLKLLEAQDQRALPKATSRVRRARPESLKKP